jgi:MFS family permease
MTYQMTGLVAERSPAPQSRARSLFVLYLVIFIGFLGYSLMITVFTPMLLDGHGAILPATTPEARRTMLLGFLLCLYPLGQFLASPVLGALSDRFGRFRIGWRRIIRNGRRTAIGMSIIIIDMIATGGNP